MSEATRGTSGDEAHDPLAGVPNGASSGGPSSAEDALESFLEHRRRGEKIDPVEFAARHPELGTELASALDALLALESVTQAAALDELPERIGAYRVLREIGRGGMGVVLEAVEEPLNRRVALKVLPPELIMSASARARFRREAELAARLDHSGIATVYGAGVEHDRPWIAMRYVEGRTLARLISEARAAGASSVQLPSVSRNARENALLVAQCLARVARALHSAHEQGVVHRDVKPSNIIVMPDGQPMLLDFGLAIAEESDGHTLTRTGETAGTPAYLAPENVSGERARPDVQSDVYALGVTLFECLALRRPFEAPTPIALYRAIVAGSTANLRAHNRDVPRDLAVVVATAMERDPARRYRSAAALADDLEACAAGRPIAARPVPLHGRLLRWARREPRQAVLASLLALTVIGAAIVSGSWWQARDEVHAAERLTRAELYENELQRGYSDVAENQTEAADADFVRALALVPGSAEAIAGRALNCMKHSEGAKAITLLDGAPSTPAFQSLRRLAAGELPAIEQTPEWFAAASALEMFIDGTRLAKQAERMPYSQRPGVAKLALSRFEEATLRSKTTRMLYQTERALAADHAHAEQAVRSAAAALVVLWPDQSRGLFTAGEVLWRYDVHAAIELLERSVALDPGWGPAHQVLGNALHEAHDLAGSERELRRAIAIDPKDADAFNTLGYVYREMNCGSSAREAFRSALLLRNQFEFWAGLGVNDAITDRPVDAEFELRAALDFDAHQGPLRVYLAEVIDKQGRREEALMELATVIGFDPKCSNGWRWLSRWRAETGDMESALEAAEAGLQFVPGDAELETLRQDLRKRLSSQR